MSYRFKKSKHDSDQVPESERVASAETHSTILQPVENSKECTRARNQLPSSHVSKTVVHSTSQLSSSHVSKRRTNADVHSTSQFSGSHLSKKRANVEVQSKNQLSGRVWPKPHPSQLPFPHLRDFGANSEPPFKSTSLMRNSASNSEPSLEQGTEHVKGNKSKPVRPRTVKSKLVVPRWPDGLEYDVTNEVLTIDAQGKHMLMSGPIQARDIINLEVGIKCAVHFNSLNQPIHKGGKALTKFLGCLAKDKRFCPIEEKSWRDIKDQFKAELVEVVRDKFLIPEGDTFNQVIFTRVDKQWRDYKSKLKTEKFNPKVRTKEQIYNDVPDGLERISWIHRVDSWYSEESEKLSLHGKKARASHSHVHTTGPTSYANKKADFVRSYGREPSHLEMFRLTHSKIDGGFVENTITSEFLAEANAKVQELISNASSSKSEVEVQNEVFDSLMYEEGKRKKPIGFGLGVKESDVFGVSGLLKKKKCDSAIGTNSCMEMEHWKTTMSRIQEENEEAIAAMRNENKELRSSFNQTNQILFQTLHAIRTKTLSDEFLNVAESTLRKAHSLHRVNSQVASTSGESEDLSMANTTRRT